MTKYRILMADGNLQFQTAVRDCLAAQEQVAQFEAVADGQRPCGKPAGRDGRKRHAA